MFKQVSILFLICFASLQAFSQTEKYIAPVKWERYKVSDSKVSILLPKLPVLVERWDVCQEIKRKEYAVYTDHTVYGFAVVSKAKEKLPFVCPKKIKFDEKSFLTALDKIKNQLKEFTEVTFIKDDLTVNKVSGNGTSYWLIDDFKNKRWFEFSIIGGSEEKAEVKNFIQSIEINKNAKGIEIGKGTSETLGDETIKSIETKVEESTPLVVVLKPQPRYTDAARRNGVIGKVSLKITFLSNGGVGSITPWNMLPDGLTEQAIIAARKIVFVPPKRNGIPYSVSKLIEYNFAIY